VKRSAFTMVELIFVIVIIGILASIAIPKFGGVTDGAKKSAELATISSVVTALESANGEWSINEGSFTWGRNRPSSELNSTTGYPDELSSSDDKPFDFVIKDSGKFKRVTNINGLQIFTGPASDAQNGVKFPTDAPNQDIANKPDKNDFWVYAAHKNDCNIACINCNQKRLYYGDFILIDVNGTSPTDYNSIDCN